MGPPGVHHRRPRWRVPSPPFLSAGREAAMAFREVRVFEVREVLRLWLAGRGVPGDRAAERCGPQDGAPLRRRGRRAGPDARRRWRAADRCVPRPGGGGGAPAPHRRPRRGVAAVGGPSRRDRGVGEGGSDRGEDPRAAGPPGCGGAVRARCSATSLEVCGRRRGPGPTVRVADGEPGDELQVDFGRMGLLHDPATGRRPGVCTR